MTTSLTRRRVLGLGAGAAIAVAAAGPAQAAPTAGERAWTERESANGWPVLDHAGKFRVEGTDVDVSLAEGDVATVLLHVARRFAYEVDMLLPGDLQGHTTEREISSAFESNHLSGTAIAIRPMHYPLGADVKNTGMSEAEQIIVADILADCEGVIAWGGHLQPVKQSHFQIAVEPGNPRLKKHADRIQGWNSAPGRGAGTIDAFAPARRRRAARFQ
ncbi:M15 family metallopeptidase [Streptomyces indiaensis]|uniref:Uncharacterized protein n=1 Tax=Streptomyces indiaensis TaxID=284033 RepID=A0ABN3EM11_9ACTN|nr:M15 family metallopeptidase [Streptomyces indiaensis]MCF1647022.1 M15 family metallopeptidase [Streptomyces indiaensis]